jgi:MoxR-like ATPase
MAMLGHAEGNPVAHHLNVVGRLDEVLGPVSEDISDLVRRMTFPWFLYQDVLKADAKGASAPAEPLAELADTLLLDREELVRIQRLLEVKKQVIFYGPPGTGKTYVAKQLGAFLAGESGSVEVVQFHASYAYEDFMEGYRPALVGGQPGFQLVPGPLKRVAERARQTPGATHVMVIDELNRSNVAKVFGELYYLLEYRDAKIALQYSHDPPFTLPGNLWIIGTMNTADRSIALVDAALRRRFYFVPFFPDQPPIEGLLQRWTARYKPDLQWVAAVVDKANERLGDRHAFIGPSYFMTQDLTEEWVDLIWRHAILPYLEEQFFGEPERLREFDLAKLREAIGDSTATA